MSKATEHIEAAHKNLREAREIAEGLPTAVDRDRVLAILDERIAQVRATFDAVAAEEDL